MNGHEQPTIDDAVRCLGAEMASVDDDHPDADVLGDYAEGGLLDSERDAVDDHLLWCRDCADLVADRELLSHTNQPSGSLPMPIDAALNELRARIEDGEKEAADDVAAGPHVTAGPRSSRSTRLRVALRLAAALILAGGWGITLQQLHSARSKNHALTQPRFGVVVTDAAISGSERGGEQAPNRLTFDATTDHLVIVLTPDEPTIDGTFVGRILTLDSSIVVEGAPLRPTNQGTFTLGLHRDSLPPGRYVIEIARAGGSSSAPERFPVEIVHTNDRATD